jgi:5-carboxymethyl-2-hydroxymuconate isomerase/acylpyruvate hydrolase
MRLATFTPNTQSNKPRLGALLDNQMLDLAACERALGDRKRGIPASMKKLLARGKPGLDRVRRLLDFARSSPELVPGETLFQLDDVIFLPPVPDAEKFLCVGKN